MSFADLWNAAGDQSGDVPDGNYDVEVIDASAFNRKSDGAEFAKLVLLVQDGELRGRTFDDFMNLNNQVGIAIARESLAMYGLDTGDPTGNVTSWANFQLALPKLIGVKANVSLSTDGVFRRVKVNTSQPSLAQHAPQATQPAPQTAQVAAGGDDDIPF